MYNQTKTLLVFFFLTVVIHAQTDFSIEGKILDKDQKPLTGIQVALIQSKDDAIVKIEMTDWEGAYKFMNLKENLYKVLIEEAEFKFYQSELLRPSIERSRVTLAPIHLINRDIKELDEVIITKKKVFVENKIDRTVVNVDAFITAAGGNALEVLEKSPGILVDQNGTITFKGKSGVQVFIDDKPTYLSGTELEAYLRSLPVGTLDKIEYQHHIQKVKD
jgi:hypothetical protein